MASRVRIRRPRCQIEQHHVHDYLVDASELPASMHKRRASSGKNTPYQLDTRKRTGDALIARMLVKESTERFVFHLMPDQASPAPNSVLEASTP